MRTFKVNEDRTEAEVKIIHATLSETLTFTIGQDESYLQFAGRVSRESGKHENKMVRQYQELCEE